jgi:hypothetical protein
MDGTTDRTTAHPMPDSTEQSFALSDKDKALFDLEELSADLTGLVGIIQLFGENPDAALSDSYGPAMSFLSQSLRHISADIDDIHMKLARDSRETKQ